MARKASLLMFFLLLFGCNNQLHVPSLHSVKEINGFKKGIFFSDIWNIQEHEGDFYFNDYKNDRILVTDSSLHLIKYFGKSGAGPGEFHGAGSFFVYDDSVYVYDEGGKRMNIFSEGGAFGRTIVLPPVKLDWTRFTILNNKIYIPSAANSDVLMLNLYGTVIKKIKTGQKESATSNSPAILHFRNQIVIVDRAKPFIKRYSDSGILLDIFDLTTIQVLHKLWDHYQNDHPPHQSKHTTILFSDAYVDQSFLYILCSGWPGRDHYTYIIKLSLDSNAIEPKKIFKIQGTKPEVSVFDSFAIKGDQLIAEEQLTGTICEFDLSKLESVN